MTRVPEATAVAAVATGGAPPGWYAQGDGGVWLGYWDGAAWRIDPGGTVAATLPVAGGRPASGTVAAATRPLTTVAATRPLTTVSGLRLTALAALALVLGVLVVTLGIVLTT